MTGRNTVVRSMHDLGLAAWFGGSLMGAVGLNGGAATASSPAERLSISSAGWGKWAPVQFLAIVVHGIGGLGLIGANKGRLGAQPEARTNTVIKTVVTGLAGASALTSAIAGRVQAKHASEGAEGVTEPGAQSSPKLSGAQRVQKFLQWTTPLLTGVMVVLAAQQGEQQRPLQGLLRTVLSPFRR